MEAKIVEIAQRIRTLREILEFSTAEMAAATDVSEERYIALENGESDFSFTFLLKCADKFGVDMIELVTGEPPKLSFFTIVRNGEGLPIKRRAGFEYNHLAYLFKHKLAETFLVTAPYIEEQQNQPLVLSTHEGQEFDYILEGSLLVDMDGHRDVLNAGDSIYYDSGHGHGMIATGGKECKFLAVVMKAPEKEEK